MNRCELCQGPTDSIGLCYNQTCRNYRGNPILQPEPSIESKVRILTPCPACNSTTLFVSDNGKLCCSLIGCSNPLAINEFAELTAKLEEARQARDVAEAKGRWLDSVKVTTTARELATALPPDILMSPMPFPDRLDYAAKIIQAAFERWFKA